MAAVLKPAALQPVVDLDTLLSDRRVWRGQPATAPATPRQPTGHAALDAVLPWGGWPEAALTELLLPADGIGELHLLLPTLARLTRAGHDIALVAPPYLPYPDGWRQAGVDFAHVHLVDANAREALWASEQCLRAGCLSAVLSWPMQADDRALRRLQVAADTGGVMGFVFREARAECNPSPAVLRIAILRQDREDSGILAEARQRAAHPHPPFGHLLPQGEGSAGESGAWSPSPLGRGVGVRAGARGDRGAAYPHPPFGHLLPKGEGMGFGATTQVRVLKCRGATAPARPVLITDPACAA
jgi:hypothetical protein